MKLELLAIGRRPLKVRPLQGTTAYDESGVVDAQIQVRGLADPTSSKLRVGIGVMEAC